MSQPLSEYFAQEAGDFLDELDALLAAEPTPDAAQLFRLARGVRGSAQIAGAGGVARVAERLEDAVRSIRDGGLPWDDAVRTRVQATSVDLRRLVASYAAGRGDEALAAEAAARWEGAGTRHREDDGSPPAGDMLAFVQREIGGVAAELDRALAELAAAPQAREPLRAVLRRMRPVRGVSGMSALAPLLEVLEALEDTAADAFSRTTPLGGEALELLTASRDVLRAATDLLGAGAALDTLLELDRFRELRDRADSDAGELDEAGVIPISRLFFDDAGPHVVSSPTAPAGNADSLRDDVEAFLRIEATGFLDRAEALIAGAPQARRRFGRVARQLASLASSVAELAGTYAMNAIAGAAHAASSALRAATSVEEARSALRSLRAALPGGAPAEPDEEQGVVPIESLLYTPGDALRAALELRERAVALAGPAGTPLGDLVDELFGLLELGRPEPAK
ncbi:MAG TPA: Hpt domain-containing protein [Longimicrobium sp.]|jgi:chemotaxis protein histidine kinase CheA